MKLLLPLSLALLLTACATPEDKAAAHQRQLEKEARENFIALKARGRKSTEPAAQIARAEPPAPTPRLRPFFRRPAPPKADDTVYLWNAPRRPETKSARYLAYEKQYAHELAKSPEDLSPEEREWVRRHYLDPHPPTFR